MVQWNYPLTKNIVSDNEGHSSTQDVCQLQLLTFEPII